MTEDQSEVIQALRTAIEIEKNGIEVFRKFAEETKNAAGKKIFLQLSRDEEKHREILEAQLEKLLDSKHMGRVSIPKSAIEKIAPRLREKALGTKGRTSVGELDALHAALDLEKKASEFFREQAEQTSIAAAKALFLRLAEWEDTHYALIKAEIDNINRTGFWLDFREFKMDGMY